MYGLAQLPLPILEGSLINRCLILCEDVLTCGLRVIANQARCQQLAMRTAALMPLLRQLQRRQLAR